ncbi:hypothetical protein GSI_03820 [Ganoderma sinense ZZ0214-1]|uniref:Transporter n=1 Tax=Ganoderma sinense ZZ0214-1 TaxID=1077348 RepID=A0A2G8SK12_9APHY|nr:hypothetical protein GSI_03820 [Ganoderma sinense ZZ0214-1]
MVGFTKFALLATAVAGLQLAGTSAQTISSQCQSSLASLLTSSDATCLNAQALLGLATTTNNASVVPTLNTWLTGLCAKPACSNQTLSAVVSNLTSGCSTELSSLGLGSIDASELTALVETAYPTVRKVACLADTKQNNELCVTEFLTAVQGTTGNLSIANIEALGTNLVGGSSSLNLPSNVTCTDCVKAAYSIINTVFAGLVPSSVPSYFQSTCGSSFTDGSSPSDVTESASAASSSTTVTHNGVLPALRLSPAVGIAASLLVTVSSALVVLA